MWCRFYLSLYIKSRQKIRHVLICVMHCFHCPQNTAAICTHCTLPSSLWQIRFGVEQIDIIAVTAFRCDFFFSKWDSTFARRVCPLSSVRKQEKKGTAIHCYRHIMGLCHSSYCLVFKHLFVWWPRTRFTVALGCMMVAAAHPILIPIADR